MFFVFGTFFVFTVLFFVLFILLNCASATYPWSRVTLDLPTHPPVPSPQVNSMVDIRGPGFESFPCKILTQTVHEIHSGLQGKRHFN